MFRYWYKKAFWHRPFVLILDNIDKLIPTAASPTSRHPMVINAHLFRETVNAKPPDKNAREMVFENLFVCPVHLFPVKFFAANTKFKYLICET
ncbi:hypothetical protein BDN72DRAFT_833003 [Pluteus cervinus]|uniref:Uncharacterized protein n=1 Tax=Pluteus cervinus TaxID=181527 RepID=A0ACD3B904_9AGAR|nr:hypothetical protein BDN72DRAFT_833003 [Pluteus cervinus]